MRQMWRRMSIIKESMSRANSTTSMYPASHARGCIEAHPSTPDVDETGDTAEAGEGEGEDERDVPTPGGTASCAFSYTTSDAHSRKAARSARTPDNTAKCLILNPDKIDLLGGPMPDFIRTKWPKFGASSDTRVRTLGPFGLGGLIQSGQIVIPSASGTLFVHGAFSCPVQNASISGLQ